MRVGVLTHPRPTQQLAADVRTALGAGFEWKLTLEHRAEATVALDALVAQVTDLEAQVRETEERLEGDLWLATQGIDRQKERAVAAEAQVAALTQERKDAPNDIDVFIARAETAEAALAKLKEAARHVCAEYEGGAITDSSYVLLNELSEES